MEKLLILTLLVSLTCQSPLPQHLSEELGLATDKLEHVQKSIRDAPYYCPFSHPSVLDPNEASHGFYRSERSEPEVPSFLQAILRPKRSAQLKSKYVNHQGQILSYASGNSIRIDATVHVSDYAHTIAAETIKKMTQHMPAYLFNSLASNTKVGVFTKAESLTVFPEYAGLAAPAGCGSSCAGHCHTQCTFDGRPYSSLAGTGGRRGVVVEDNVLCNSQDPYRSQDNILVHEYAHTIKSYGLSSSLKRRITAAYNNAKSHSLWTHQYSMETEEEYWAVGTEAWFNTIHTTYATGGMNVLATDKEEHVQKSTRDVPYYCPFSHPSVLDPNEASPETYRSERSEPEVPSFLQTVLRAKRSVQLKSKYVNRWGQILSYASGNSIRVDATLQVSDNAHMIAATTIKEMTQHMPWYIFNRLASNTKVGVFTKEESLTVFPEFTGYAAPAGCSSSSCVRRCRSQCTRDGRPYSSLAGLGGQQRAAVLDDNVLCNSEDPYNSQENILVHEYAHTIKAYGLSSSQKRRITAAYRNARRHSLWTYQYSMTTEDEYWAVGTEAWFNTIHTTDATGGMNVCDGYLCSTGLEARLNLYNRDVTLYGLLSEVYFNGDVSLQPGLQSCTTLH